MPKVIEKTDWFESGQECKIADESETQYLIYSLDPPVMSEWVDKNNIEGVEKK